MTWIAVAVGGALGSLARHWVNAAIAHRHEHLVTWSTFAINVLGCFAIGTLAGQIAAGRLHLTPFTRAFVFVGVLGGFTTFSTFALDTLTLGHGGHHAAAAWNVLGQVSLGLAVAWLGYYFSL